ncbi:hypothetical protein [Streptomyces sp. NPDC001889]
MTSSTLATWVLPLAGPAPAGPRPGGLRRAGRVLGSLRRLRPGHGALLPSAAHARRQKRRRVPVPVLSCRVLAVTGRLLDADRPFPRDEETCAALRRDLDGRTRALARGLKTQGSLTPAADREAERARRLLVRAGGETGLTARITIVMAAESARELALLADPVLVVRPVAAAGGVR